MGYTHTWNEQAPCTVEEWRHIRVAVLQLLANNPDIPVAWESDCDGVTHPFKAPEVSADLIRFNGLGDDGLETFFVQREGGGYAFCKTGRKPYDALVVASLALMHHYAPIAWEYGSDGDPEDWEEGLQLASDAAGEPVETPFPTRSTS